MKLSVILLTWNSQKFINQCIDSIIDNSDSVKDFEIIIVDNGSTDKTLEIITKTYPSIKLIRNSLNSGVAPARNQGIVQAKGEYILILDIDTIVQKDAIPCMIRLMDKHPDIGVCGPKLVDENGIRQDSCRKFPLVQTKFLRRFDIPKLRKLLFDELYAGRFDEKKAENISMDGFFEVDYVIGACQMIRREALNATGLLDENIFYGPEDVDLCLRMWLKGWKVVYYPEAVVTHFEQRITKKKLLSSITIKHIKGLFYYFIKHKYLISRSRIYKKIQLANKNKIGLS